MTISKKFLSIAAAALLSLGGVAQAQDSVESVLKTTGCYAGLIGGYSMTSANTTVGDGTSGINFDGLSAKGMTGGGIVGCDVKIGSHLVFGGWADYQFKDVGHNSTLFFGPDSFNASFGIKNGWTVGGRLGVQVHPSALLYGLVGYTQAEADDLNLGYNGSSVATFDIPTLKGWVFGGGIETNIGNGFSLRGEYRYTKYDDVSLSLAPGLNADMKLEDHAAMASIVYRFGK